MPAITRLSQRTIFLEQGELVRDGTSRQIVSTYLNSGHGTMAERTWAYLDKAPGGEVARLRAVRVRSEDGQITEAIDIRQPVSVEMEYEVLKPGYVLLPNLQFRNIGGDTASQQRFSERFNTYLPGNLIILKKYGAIYLGREEYEQCLRRYIRGYYGFLASSVFYRRGKPILV